MKRWKSWFAKMKLWKILPFMFQHCSSLLFNAIFWLQGYSLVSILHLQTYIRNAFLMLREKQTKGETDFYSRSSVIPT